MKMMKTGKYIYRETKQSLKKVGGDNVATLFDLVWCACLYGASPSNYANFDLKHASREERKTFLTHRYNEKIMRKYNSKGYIWQLQNKYEFAVRIEDSYGRKYFHSRELSYDNLKTIEKLGKIVYKPICGGQGRDILVFDSTDELATIFDKIKNLPDGIVEEWIEQDDRMTALCADAVNPIRVQTLMTDKVNIIAATLTIANGTSIANASATHAIFALIDIDSGIVKSDGCDYDGNYYLVHPTTNIRIKGFQIPYWHEIIRLVTENAQKFQNVRHIGWDIAISKNGPIIIEGNNDPGYTAYQLPQLTKTHTGILPLYKKFL